MRVGIITAFNERYAPIADITLPIMKAYAEKHGYALHVGAYHEDATRLKTYGDRMKIELYNRHYDAHDVLVWLDIDVLIMNSDVTIEERLGDYPFVWSYDVNGPCSGFWIARCTPMVKLALDAVAGNAPNRGKIMTREDMGPPHRVIVQLEPHGSSDQDEMTRLMNIPPFNAIFGYCLSGKELGHTFLYDRLGWHNYKEIGDYSPGDWMLTFPSEPLEDRIEFMREWAEKAT